MTRLRRLGRVVIAQGGSTPSLVHLQSGNLLVAYRGYIGNRPVVNIVHSRDGGRTWSEPETVVGAHPNTGHYLVHLGIGQLRNGIILLPFQTEREAYLIKSRDNGKSWDEPVRLSPDGVAPGKWLWAHTYGRVRELSDGTVILPVNGQQPGDYYWRVGLFISPDHGETWDEFVTVAYGLDDEFDTLEVEEGKIISIHRDWKSPHEGHGMSPLYWSHSEDGGRTWAEPKVTFQAMYGHSPCLFMTKKRQIICGYRYVGDLDLNLCGVAFSYARSSDGTMWSGWPNHVVLIPGYGIEVRLGCGYPSFDYADEERIICAYHTTSAYTNPRDIEATVYIEEE